MCGRYVHPDEAAIEQAWHIGRSNSNPFRRRFNVAPTMTVPIVRLAEDGTELELAQARWSFVPHWWKEAKLPTMTFNARSEEAARKPMWRFAYGHGKAHCLVPAESWYEWQQRERVDPATGEVTTYKQPFNLHRSDGKPFAFAGLMSWWQAPGGGEGVLTCAILTQAARGKALDVHERMPTVLTEEGCRAWLDPALADATEVARIVAQAQDDFDYFPVSTRVNSARYDGADLIEPIASME